MTKKDSKKNLFDFVVGNPPYQEEFTADGNKTYAAPVYNDFIDASINVTDFLTLIHPARFLFNAGSTPKAWNRKMLDDPHFKVLKYEEDASKVFANTEIKGGVAITCYDKNKIYDPIVVFAKYPLLNDILAKFRIISDIISFSSIVVTSYAYHFTEYLYKETPEARGCLSNGHEYDLKSNVFVKMPFVFLDRIPNDGNEYIKILGRNLNDRVYKYIRRDFVNEVCNLDAFKVIVPAANGAGLYGEVLSQPLIAEPGVGTTETFVSIGAFGSYIEAECCLKYIKTKFARALLGVLKSTQHITPEKWTYVPLQDFTLASDIDWSQSVADIDKQLYKKYALTEEEINFIETQVKEMV